MHQISLNDLAQNKPIEPLLEKEVQMRAYELYEQRGFRIGYRRKQRCWIAFPVPCPVVARLRPIMSQRPSASARKPRTKLQIIAKAVADGAGSVTLPNIPVGSYTVIMQSSHAKGGQGANMVNHRDLLGRFKTSTITISAGQVVDVSTDFGMSAF